MLEGRGDEDDVINVEKYVHSVGATTVDKQ
jgi:hypothetical protein